MIETITASIDLWTSTQMKKSSVGRGTNSKQFSYGMKKLRELILELAVRGKLVPQDPNDEPASDLLKKIIKEKERLIKEGKFKKQEPLSKVSNEEEPFDAPLGWRWDRLGNLSSNVHYGYTASAEHDREGVRLLRITDIQNDRVDWKTVPGCEITELKAQTYLLENDDVLIARTGGTIGKSYLVENINVLAVFASYLIRVQRISAMYAPFIKTFLGSTIYWKQLYENSAGTGQPNVNATALKNLLIPVPPLEEQKRIVAKVDELMALCDQLEKEQEDNLETHQVLVKTLLRALTNVNDDQDFQETWKRIENHFGILFTTEESINQLKQTLLQLAVMGKLVPQDPNDEPASVLLEKIKEEKNKLIKKGQIRKQAQLAGITQEEIAFNCPEGWVWVKMGELLEMFNGRAFQSTEWGVKGVPIIRIQNLNDPQAGFNYFDGDIDEKHRVADGDFLISWSGTPGTSFGAFIWKRGPAALNQHINKCWIFHKQINFEYLKLAVNSCMEHLISKAQGGVGLKHVTKGTLNNIIFGLPPLVEQQRIVAKVDELMTLCDSLKKKINEAQNIQIQLADAVVESAVS